LITLGSRRLFIERYIYEKEKGPVSQESCDLVSLQEKTSHNAYVNAF
jgi:hypothetical protein